MVEEVIIRVIRIMVDSGSEYLPKDAQTKGIEVMLFFQVLALKLAV